MRNNSRSGGVFARIGRLSFAMASFILTFFVAHEALAWCGTNVADAKAGGLLIALGSLALAMYG